MALKKSFCRLCQAMCGTMVDVRDNRVSKVLGDRTHPVSSGYSC